MWNYIEVSKGNHKGEPRTDAPRSYGENSWTLNVPRDESSNESASDFEF